MSEQTYTDNLVTATEIIAQAIVDGVQFDKTILATIVDDSDRDNGRYYVSDGSTKFLAYSDVTKFKNNDLVYVTVPNGNFSEQKIIIGKKTDLEDEPFNYFSPFDNLFVCTDNIINSVEGLDFGRFQLIANDDKDSGNLKRKLETRYPEYFSSNYTYPTLEVIPNTFPVRYQSQSLSFNNDRDGWDSGIDEVSDTELQENPSSFSQEIIDKRREIRAKRQEYRELLIKEITKVTIPDTEEGKKSFADILNKFNGGFSRLGIKVDFQSLLARENIKSGNYGLQLHLKAQVLDVINANNYNYQEIDFDKELTIADGEEYEKFGVFIWNSVDKNYQKLESVDLFDKTIDPKGNIISYSWKDEVKSLKLYKQNEVAKIQDLYYNIDTKDMIGNPYSFEILQEQQKVFDFSNIVNIQEAELIFFQNQDFEKKDGTRLVSADYYNLFASGIEMYLGYDLSEIQDEFIKLYTFDSLNYQHVEEKDKLQNQKHIQLRWAHKNGDKISIYSKENIESWFDDLFDSGEIENLKYSYRLDDSPTPIENREYFQNVPTSISGSYPGDSSKEFFVYRIYDVANNNTQQPIEKFVIDQQQPFLSVSSIKSKEQYFEKRLMTIKAFNENYCTNFFRDYNEKEYTNLLGSMLKDYKAQIYKKVIKALTLNDVADDFDFSAHTFYSDKNGTIYAESVHSKNDLIPGKIYYYSSYEADDSNIFNNLEAANIPNSNNESLYIEIFYPIDRNTETNELNTTDLDIKLGIGQIYRPNYRSYNSETDADLTIYTFDNLEKIENFTAENPYEPNKFYYKAYEVEGFEIRWYRYELGAPSADEYCGLYWTRIPNQVEGLETYVDADEPAFNCTLMPDCVYNKTEQIKVIILIDQEDGTKKPYYSNILTFENKDDVISIPTAMQEMALRLQIDDETFGNYYLYDESNMIIDKSLATKQRSLTVLFSKEDFTSRTRLTDADSVIWTFPIVNTMLQVDTTNSIGTYAVSEVNPSYGTLTVTSHENQYQLFYSIKDKFSFANGNNTITCTIVKDEETFSTTQEFSFGQSGSNGSDYTLVLDLLTSDNMITVNPANQLQPFQLVNVEDLQNGETYFEYKEADQTLTSIIYQSSDNRELPLYQKINFKDILGVDVKTEKDDNNNDIVTKVTSIQQYVQIKESDDINDQQKALFDKIFDYFTNKESIVNIKDLKNQYEYFLRACFYKETKNDSEDETKTTEFYHDLYNYFDDYIEIIKGKSSKLSLEKCWEEIVGNLYYIPFNQYVLYGYSASEFNPNLSLYNVIKTTTPVEQNLIRASLYDQSGNRIIGENYEVKWSFYIQDSSFTLDPSEREHLSNIVKFSSETSVLGDSVALLFNQNKTESEILNQAFIIVQATLTNFGDYELTSYLPIPLRKDYGITRYQGPTEIIYSSTGYPNYYKDEINLYYNNTSGNENTYDLSGFQLRSYYEIVTFKKENYLPTLNLDNEKTYTVTYKKTTDTKFNSNKNYYIKTDEGTYEKLNIFNSDSNSGHDDSKKITLDFDTVQKEKGTIYEKIKGADNNIAPKLVMTPASTFIQGFSTFAIQYVHEGKVIFTQPILNIQNRFFSSTINKWDGALSIDNDKNTILAKMIGAGSKDSSNRFSGVILGDWSGNVNKNDGGNLSLANNIGLYGFNEGETSFGFTSQGIGFIGKAGRGRILLDGNESVITSSNWVMNSDSNNAGSSRKQGLYMKIDDGFLIMRDSNTGHYIKLDAMADPDGPNNYYKNYGEDDSKTETNKNNSNYIYRPTNNPLPATDNKISWSEDERSTEYPFVVYGNSKNYTAIGWNGNLLLSGTHKTYTTNEAGKLSIKDDDSNGTDEAGYIYLNAAAEKYPLDINNHFAVAWNGALTISRDNISDLSDHDINTSGEEKDPYKFLESSQGIVKDDQRGYGEEPTDNKKYKEQYDENVHYEKTFKVDTSNKLNDASKISSTQSKWNNPYDYSEISTGFHGLYANPEGDLYLSRKLIIGNKFSATADGYLKAKSALFDDCNANVFQVRYLPDGSNTASVDFNKQHYVSTIDYDKKSTADYGAKIGNMGWVTGATEDTNTWNLGIQSAENAGIILESQTNMRLEAGLQDDRNYDGGLFLKSPRILSIAESTNEIYTTVEPSLSASKEDIWQSKRRDIGKSFDNPSKILIGSTGIIESVAKNQIRFGIAGDRTNGIESQSTQTKYFDVNGGFQHLNKPTYYYNAEFMITQADAKGPGDEDEAPGTLIRLQIPEKVRLALGQDSWSGKSQKKSATGARSDEWDDPDRFLLSTFGGNKSSFLAVNWKEYKTPVSTTSNTIMTIDGDEPEITLSRQEPYQEDSSDITSNSNAKLYTNSDAMKLTTFGYDYFNAAIRSGLVIGTYNSTSNSAESAPGVPQVILGNFLKMDTSYGTKLESATNLNLWSGGMAGPRIDLISNTSIGNWSNLSRKTIYLHQTPTILGEADTNVKIQVNGKSSESNGGIEADSSGDFHLHSNSVHFDGSDPEHQYGIYARFA